MSNLTAAMQIRRHHPHTGSEAGLAEHTIAALGARFGQAVTTGISDTGIVGMLRNGPAHRAATDDRYRSHRPAATMATDDNFEITVLCQGLHTACPHMGVDPIPPATAIVLAPQQIVARQPDPVAPAVCPATKFITETTAMAHCTTATDFNNFVPPAIVAYHSALMQGWQLLGGSRP